MDPESANSLPTIKVPMLDLKTEHAPIEAELRGAVDDVFASCDFVLGKAVDRFEREFADYCGATEAVAWNMAEKGGLLRSRAQVAFTLGIDSWNGREKPSGKVRVIDASSRG